MEGLILTLVYILVFVIVFALVAIAMRSLLGLAVAFLLAALCALIVSICIAWCTVPTDRYFSPFNSALWLIGVGLLIIGIIILIVALVAGYMKKKKTEEMMDGGVPINKRLHQSMEVDEKVRGRLVKSDCDEDGCHSTTVDYVGERMATAVPRRGLGVYR